MYCKPWGCQAIRIKIGDGHFKSAHTRILALSRTHAHIYTHTLNAAPVCLDGPHPSSPRGGCWVSSCPVPDLTLAVPDSYYHSTTFPFVGDGTNAVCDWSDMRSSGFTGINNGIGACMGSVPSRWAREWCASRSEIIFILSQESQSETVGLPRKALACTGSFNIIFNIGILWHYALERFPALTRCARSLRAS